jgi:predicted GIY-YIG superfamily endonuclease
MTDLYRVFDAADQLLYVGITEDLFKRLSQHRDQSGWFDQASRLVIEWYGTREACRQAESSAIKAERPLWNRQESPCRGAAEDLVATSRRGLAFAEIGPDEFQDFVLRCRERGRRQFDLFWNAEHRSASTSTT